MPKIYKTAMGKQIDVDSLVTKNEHVIAVGNYKVNARGDELGPGGKVIKTRDQIMKEYYALSTPVPEDHVIPDNSIPKHAPMKQPAPQTVAVPTPVVDEPVVINPNSGMDEVDDGPAVESTPLPVGEPVPQERSPNAELRGSLASAVAKTATVTQVAKLPPKKANGIQRF